MNKENVNNTHTYTHTHTTQNTIQPYKGNRAISDNLDGTLGHYVK